MVQEDITKMEQELDQLKTAGSDLFADEIVALQGRINAAKEEIIAEATKAAQNANAEVSEVNEKVNSWWVEHRNDIYQAVEIIALAYIIYRLAC
jgi:hypothetical protein